MSENKSKLIIDFCKKESAEIGNYDKNRLLPLANFRNFNNKTADLTLSTKQTPFLSTTPRTNLERVIETLNDIADEFNSNNNTEYKLKTKWVIKEILSNKMYKYETRSQNSKEENRLLQLYSPDFDEEFEVKLNQSNSLKEVDKEYEEDNQISEEGNQFVIKIKEPIKSSPTQTLVKPIQLSSFGVNFDVFSYAETVGRVNLMSSVFKSVMSYKDCYSLLKTSYVDNYVEGLRKGYTSEKGAFYHNVSL